jgi:hypothetical protein
MDYLTGLHNELIVVAILVIIVGAVRFEMFCLRDIAEAEEVFVFSRQVWIVITILSIPFGGLFYLLYGRRR